MSRKVIVYVLFGLGIVLFEVHTTLAVLWQLAGSTAAYPLSRSVVMYYAQGFTPILGAVLLLAAGLVYEKVENVK